MRHLLHPKFKLNGQVFSSEEDLKQRANHFIDSVNEDEAGIGKFILEWLDTNDFIYVKTSGSTGVPKSIKLQKEHVKNSAEATATYFDLVEGTKALLCLSSEYIAGKMMLVRAMIAGWDLHSTPPKKNPLEGYDFKFDFTAMVPYQVHYSLSELHKVKKMIVGGGAVSNALEHQLQQVGTNIFATYGMTETISHVAIRAINGKKRSSVFEALPEVNFSENVNGCLQIHAPKISTQTVVTNDVVELFSPKSFKLLGRIDNVINTGGVKIHPEMVEEKLAAHLSQPFFIASEKDEILEKRVILIIESHTHFELNDFTEILKVLSPYERPKKILSTTEFFYTDTGKIRRDEVLKTLKIS